MSQHIEAEAPLCYCDLMAGGGPCGACILAMGALTTEDSHVMPQSEARRRRDVAMLREAEVER